MNKENESVELFDDEEIITLTDDEGNDADFAQIACVEYEGKFYALLEPVDQLDDFDENEVMVCLIEPVDDEFDNIIPVEDPDLAQKIFDEFLKKVEAEDFDDCDCDDGDCSCSDCEGNCDK